MTEQRTKLPQSLETQRLRLRLITPDDAPALNTAIARSFPQLRPWMPWAAQLPTLAQTTEFCAAVEKRFQDNTGLDLVIEERRSGELIGATGYPRLDWSVPSFEIGYWCRSDKTGMGLISEATLALADHAFTKLNAARVELVIDNTNSASIAVAQRLGFVCEGVLRSHDRNTAGELCDTRIYALTDSSKLIAP